MNRVQVHFPGFANKRVFNTFLNIEKVFYTKAAKIPWFYSISLAIAIFCALEIDLSFLIVLVFKGITNKCLRNTKKKTANWRSFKKHLI